MTFSHSAYSTIEDDGFLQFVLLFTNPSAFVINITVTTSDLTATGMHTYTCILTYICIQAPNKLKYLYAFSELQVTYVAKSSGLYTCVSLVGMKYSDKLDKPTIQTHRMEIYDNILKHCHYLTKTFQTVFTVVHIYMHKYNIL